MLDLKRMPDEEFRILVTPSVPKTVMYVKVEENGNALLCSKAAERLAKIPDQLRFNKDCTAIQLFAAGSENSVIFPKSGRKTMPNAAKLLAERKAPFPVVFVGSSSKKPTNGEENASQTLRCGPRKLPAAPGRNRSAPQKIRCSLCSISLQERSVSSGRSRFLSRARCPLSGGRTFVRQHAFRPGLQKN